MAQETFVTGEDVIFEYGSETKLHRQMEVEVEMGHVDDSYPISRIIKQDPNGDVVVQELQNSHVYQDKDDDFEDLNCDCCESHSTQYNSFEKQTEIIQEQIHRPIKSNYLWDFEHAEEIPELRKFWIDLPIDKKRKMSRIEPSEVMTVIQDDPKTNCNCRMCGNRKLTLENELQKLYEGYYSVRKLATESLDECQLNINLINAMLGVPSDTKDTIDNKQEVSSKNVDISNILSVADDLVKNNGENFISLIEQINHSNRNSSNAHSNDDLNPNMGSDNYIEEEFDSEDFLDGDDDEEEEEEEEEDNVVDIDNSQSIYKKENDKVTRKRLEETYKMLQLITSKVLRTKVYEAFKAKKADDISRSLLDDIEAEETRKREKEERQRKKREKEKERKRLQREAKEESKRRQEEEKIMREQLAKEENQRKMEEGRKRKDAEKKKREDEARRKAEEKKRRKEAEQEKKKKEKEEKDSIKLQEKLKRQEEERQKQEDKLAKEKTQKELEENANIAQNGTSGVTKSNSTVSPSNYHDYISPSGINSLNGMPNFLAPQSQSVPISNMPLFSNSPQTTPMSNIEPPTTSFQFHSTYSQNQPLFMNNIDVSHQTSIPPLNQTWGSNNSLLPLGHETVQHVLNSGSVSPVNSNSKYMFAYDNENAPHNTFNSLPVNITNSQSQNQFMEPQPIFNEMFHQLNLNNDYVASDLVNNNIGNNFFNERARNSGDLINDGSIWGASNNALNSNSRSNSIWNTNGNNFQQSWESPPSLQGNTNTYSLSQIRLIQIEAIEACNKLPKSPTGSYSTQLLFHWVRTVVDASVPNMTLAQFTNALQFDLGMELHAKFYVFVDEKNESCVIITKDFEINKASQSTGLLENTNELPPMLNNYNTAASSDFIWNSIK
ncbi:Nst1 protein [Martiniozyma asiatica (nom. inval.)]|nr:Nst1 protein [Martiniozyma asiatica]